jgi:hypothetical protein
MSDGGSEYQGAEQGAIGDAVVYGVPAQGAVDGAALQPIQPGIAGVEQGLLGSQMAPLYDPAVQQGEPSQPADGTMTMSPLLSLQPEMTGAPLLNLAEPLGTVQPRLVDPMERIGGPGEAPQFTAQQQVDQGEQPLYYGERQDPDAPLYTGELSQDPNGQPLYTGELSQNPNVQPRTLWEMQEPDALPRNTDEQQQAEQPRYTDKMQLDPAGQAPGGDGASQGAQPGALGSAGSSGQSSGDSGTGSGAGHEVVSASGGPSVSVDTESMAAGIPILSALADRFNALGDMSGNIIDDYNLCPEDDPYGQAYGLQAKPLSDQVQQAISGAGTGFGNSADAASQMVRKYVDTNQSTTDTAASLRSSSSGD